MAPDKEKARKKASKARKNRRKAAKRGITRRVIKGAERLAALEFTGRERAEMVEACAAAGVNVCVEKPMAASLPGALRMARSDSL